MYLERKKLTSLKSYLPSGLVHVGRGVVILSGFLSECFLLCTMHIYTVGLKTRVRRSYCQLGYGICALSWQEYLFKWESNSFKICEAQSYLSHLWWIDLCWMPGAHQAPVLLPFTGGQGREDIMKGWCITIRTETTHQLQSLTKWAKLGEISFIYC